MKIPLDGLEEQIAGANPFLTYHLGDITIVIYFRDGGKDAFGDFVLVAYRNGIPTDAIRFSTLYMAWDVLKRFIALEKKKLTGVITCK